MLPHWGDVSLVTLKSVGELEAKAPPPIDGAQFKRDMDEVRRLGARNSSERNAEQTATAIFRVIATEVPWNAAARAAAAAKNASVVDNARVRADQHGRRRRVHLGLGDGARRRADVAVSLDEEVD
jgi:hypothetical protein